MNAEAPHPPIFIVDDEEAVRRSLARMLGAIGVPAETYESATDFLERWAGARDGCLLVDMRMPGMSGLDLVEELARRGHALPVIIMTGQADERSLKRLELLKPMGFLEKPFSVGDLRALVERWRQTFA